MRQVGALYGSLSKQAHTQDKEEACKNQALISIRSWNDSSSKEEHHHKRRGHKHSSSSSSRVCLMARGNESSSSSESDSDDDMPSYNEIV